MATNNLTASVRTETGKGASRRARRDVGEAGGLQNGSHAGAQRPPDIGQRSRRSAVRQIAEPDVTDTGERAVDAPQHIGDADSKPNKLCSD